MWANSWSLAVSKRWTPLCVWLRMAQLNPASNGCHLALRFRLGGYRQGRSNGELVDLSQASSTAFWSERPPACHLRVEAKPEEPCFLSLLLLV